MFAAVDIGASSGRVILGRVGGSPGGRSAELETVHRFPNGVREPDGGLRWDFDALFAEVLTGLAAAATAAAARGEQIASIGIDTWAVDYGLVNAAGELVAAPFSYRDDRSRAAVARVHQKLDPARLYATTGLQFLPFNTLYQLATEPDLDGLQALLIPDLIGFLLTGQRRTEATNASTTGLFDAVAGEWATEFLTALGLPAGPVPAADPARRNPRHAAAGDRRTDRAARRHAVVAVGSHDTASAVAAVPAERATSPISPPAPGRWWASNSTHPVLTEASRTANFTNERGVDGTIRYLRNVGGLWLLSECQRTWAARGSGPAPGRTAGRRGGAAARRTPDQRRRPGVHSAGEHARTDPRRRPAHRRHPTEQPTAIVRCILDSLAAGYARTIRDAERLAGQQHRRRAHRGRRVAEPAPLPAHRRRHRETRHRGPRGSHRPRQRAGAGAGGR